MAETDDKDLVVAARGGDRDAFSKLVARNKRRVFHTAFQLLGSEADAEDVSQEAFVRAFRAISKFDGRSAFSTWMYRITVNTSLNHLRNRDRQRQVSMDEYPLPAKVERETASDDKRRIEARSLWTEVARAIGELNEDLKVVLVLGQLQGLTHGQIAEVLEIAEGTVAWRLHQARKMLRSALGPALDTLAPAEVAAARAEAKPEPGAEAPSAETAPAPVAEDRAEDDTEKRPPEALTREEAEKPPGGEAAEGPQKAEETASKAPAAEAAPPQETAPAQEPAKESAPSLVKETDAAKAEEEAQPVPAAAEEAAAGERAGADTKAADDVPATEEPKARRRTRKKKSEADRLAAAAAEMDVAASMTAKKRRKKSPK